MYFCRWRKQGGRCKKWQQLVQHLEPWTWCLIRCRHFVQVVPFWKGTRPEEMLVLAMWVFADMLVVLHVEMPGGALIYSASTPEHRRPWKCGKRCESAQTCIQTPSRTRYGMCRSCGCCHAFRRCGTQHDTRHHTIWCLCRPSSQRWGTSGKRPSRCSGNRRRQRGRTRTAFPTPSHIRCVWVPIRHTTTCTDGKLHLHEGPSLRCG